MYKASYIYVLTSNPRTTTQPTFACTGVSIRETSQALETTNCTNQIYGFKYIFNIQTLFYVCEGNDEGQSNNTICRQCGLIEYNSTNTKTCILMHSMYILLDAG